MADPPAMSKPDLYVIARLLERLWREERPIIKTRLQTATNLNYDVFFKYLTWMADKGLVEITTMDDGHEGIALTPRGMDAYRKLVQWINEVIKNQMPPAR